MDKVSAGLEFRDVEGMLEAPREAPLGAEFGGGMVMLATPRVKTSLRLRYEAESEVIRKKLGDLETIRGQLGLSQRKIAQLLLVDPSAWTCWTKAGEKAPPHVYRMLQWYLALQEKYPALDVNFWLNTVSRRPEVSQDETKALLKEISILKARIAVLEAANESGVGPMSSSPDFVPVTRPAMKSEVEEQGKAAQVLFFAMIALALAALIFGFLA